jgi:hypothetical protein
MPHDINWSESTWKNINQAVLIEVGKLRVAQKVFPSSDLEGSQRPRRSRTRSSTPSTMH